MSNRWCWNDAVARISETGADGRQYVRFSTTRRGGVSTGEYGSFNLGAFCGDDAARVAENRRRLCRALSVDEEALLVPRQVHADRVVAIDAAWMQQSAEEREASLDGCDALITALPDVAVAVTTADCTPVVLVDPIAGVVAAVHAGWRSTALRIAGRTVEKMETLYGCRAADIRATVFPCIGQSAYPVGEEVIRAVARAGVDPDEVAIRANTGESLYYLDLAATNRRMLIQSGLPEEQIERTSECTFTRNHLFFSARRQGFSSGRMLSGALIRPASPSSP